jgi:hypothetical protein
VEDIKIEDRLSNFIKNFSDDLCSLELLLFFSRHPNARFNRSAITHSLTTKKFDTGVALKHLTDQKMVVAYFEHGITLYALTKEEPILSLALDLVNIDQKKWQDILEHILNAQGIP